MTDRIMGFTGHRKIRGTFVTRSQKERLMELGCAAIERYVPDAVISGMALGWDTAVARAAIEMGVPLIAAVPFLGQELKWAEWSQDEYAGLLARAKEVVIVCEGGYAPWKLQKRNEWIVDHCTDLFALWDGGTGGTANCVKYATGKVPVHNLWSSWLKYEKSPVFAGAR